MEFAYRPLWIDEIEQLRGITGTFSNLIIHYLPSLPGAMPGDYVLTWPFAQISTDKWILAIPHFFCMIGLYLVFIFLAKEKVRNLFFFALALYFLSVNKTLAYHALELRPYASIPLLALLTFTVTRSAIEKPNLSRSQIVGYIVLFALVLSYHLYGIFMLGGSLMYHIVYSRKENSLKTALVRSLMWCSGACLLTFPVWNHIISKPTPLHEGATFEFIQGPWYIKAKSVIALLTGTPRIYPFLIPVALSFLPGCADRMKRAWFIVWLTVLPILAILYLDVQSNYYFVQRQFVWCMPFWALWMAWSMEALWNHARTWRPFPTK